MMDATRLNFGFPKNQNNNSDSDNTFLNEYNTNFRKLADKRFYTYI
jgi:hypothetical protein